VCHIRGKRSSPEKNTLRFWGRVHHWAGWQGCCRSSAGRKKSPMTLSHQRFLSAAPCSAFSSSLSSAALFPSPQWHAIETYIVLPRVNTNMHWRCSVISL
jgi:hypothetical protein